VAGPALLGADTADGKLYISGLNTTIYREKIESLSLAARVVNNHFVVDLTVPQTGNYRLLKTEDIGSTWNTLKSYTNVSGQVTWEDPNPVNGAGFYVIEQVP
jgi:hypothetical protein